MDPVTNKLLQGTPYAGMGGTQERNALIGVIRNLISEDKYTVDYILNYAQSVGYQRQMAEEVFKELTGLSPKLIVNNNEYYNMPSYVPNMCIAWGTSKSNKEKAFYIVPFEYGYAVMEKDEVNAPIPTVISATIPEAFEELKKVAKGIQTLDKIITKKLLEAEDVQTDAHTVHQVNLPYAASPLQILKKNFKDKVLSVSEFERQASKLLASEEITVDEAEDLMAWKQDLIDEDETYGNDVLELDEQWKPLDADVDEDLESFDYTYSLLVNGNIDLYKERLNKMSKAELMDYISWAEEMGIGREELKLHYITASKQVKSSNNFTKQPGYPLVFVSENDEEVLSHEEFVDMWNEDNPDNPIGEWDEQDNAYFDWLDQHYNVMEDEMEEYLRKATLPKGITIKIKPGATKGGQLWVEGDTSDKSAVAKVMIDAANACGWEVENDQKTASKKVKSELSADVKSEMEQEAQNIIKKFKPYVIKWEADDNGGSVLIGDKNSDFQAWVDVWISGNDVDCDWNQYITHVNDPKEYRDLQVRNDTETVFDLATSEAIYCLEQNNIIAQDETARWFMVRNNKKNASKKVISESVSVKDLEAKAKHYEDLLKEEGYKDMKVTPYFAYGSYGFYFDWTRDDGKSGQKFTGLGTKKETLNNLKLVYYELVNRIDWFMKRKSANSNLNDSIKEWYTKTYKTDECGADINPNTTFMEVLSDAENAYDLIGVTDSVVRERVFDELSKRTNIPYEKIFNMWMGKQASKKVKSNNKDIVVIDTGNGYLQVFENDDTYDYGGHQVGEQLYEFSINDEDRNNGKATLDVDDLLNSKFYGIVFEDFDKLEWFVQHIKDSNTQQEIKNLLNKEAKGVYSSKKVTAENMTLDDIEAEDNKDQVQEEIEKIDETPTEDIFSETTPEQYFDKALQEDKVDTINDVVSKCIDKFSEKFKDFDKYQVKILSYNTKVLEDDKPVQEEMVEDKELNANAILQVILQITNNSEEANIKKVLAVFSITNGELHWTGTVRGENDQVVAFTEEGFDALFEVNEPSEDELEDII